jgi:hypothetical protein
MSAPGQYPHRSPPCFDSPFTSSARLLMFACFVPKEFGGSLFGEYGLRTE